MKKEKKEKKTFSIADKNPYIGVILEILWAYLLTSVIGPMVAGIAVSIYERTTGNSFLNQEIVPAVVSIIVSIIFLCVHKKKIGKKFDGYFSDKNIKFGCLLMLVWVGYWVFNTISVAIFSKAGLPQPEVYIWALQAGVVEETIFRIVPIFFVMRHRENKKLVIYTFIVSSVLFGMVHIMNVTAGAPMDITIFQVVAAGMMGFFMAACYLRTGNILFGIIPHFINDIVAGTDVGLVSDNLVMQEGLRLYNLFDLGMTIVIGIIGIYLIKSVKYDEIKALWDDKFTKTENN